MNQRSIAKTILFAVGSLPFWCGKKKIKKVLAGDAGSYWNRESPLKPVYLNHYFFDSLGHIKSSEISRYIQSLIKNNYFQITALSKSKPYRVLKLTGNGVKKYYNLLVTNRGFENPFWRIHHVNQLENSPKSAIQTGGRILQFSGETYLTQTPGFSEPQQQVRDDKTIIFRNNVESLEPNQKLRIKDAIVRVDDTPILTLTDSSSIQTSTGSDLGRKLSHFSNHQVREEGPNPYVLTGRIEKINDVNARFFRILLVNSEEEKLRIRVPRNMEYSPDELSENQQYVVGPVQEVSTDTDTSDEFELELSNDGQLQMKYTG